MAITLIKHYRPLVEIIVLSPSGRLVARRSMNEDIMNRFPRSWAPDPALTDYFLEFLRDAAQEARGVAAAPGVASPVESTSEP
ncbi:MAG: hypothetical protein VX938_12755 [Myxococcota bacterium]|nr:hypothetical protein [Myxococcota bacterium]